MAKRKFELPRIDELSKDQERAIRLPLEGRHLIVGGPGTGKTVVALLRLRRHIQEFGNRNSIFLVYNRLLHEAARQLFGKGIASDTWIKWFMRTYYRITNNRVPRIESDNDWPPIDWEAVIENINAIKELANDAERRFVFIDEGQDMPPQFYQALIRLGFENFYVVADQNQTITHENSSRQDIENVLCIDTDQVIELTENYRNSYQVARLASEFYPDDPASPPVNLPSLKRTSQIPYIIEYGNNCRLQFNDVITRILKMLDRDPAKLIGILTPNNNVRELYVKAFHDIAQQLTFDNGQPRIITYASGDHGEYRFDEGGIFVINANSSKGLEFDIVFIADIHCFCCRPTIQIDMKRRFYVMVSRAKERILMLKEAGQDCPVDVILPKDETILKRWR